MVNFTLVYTIIASLIFEAATLLTLRRKTLRIIFTVIASLLIFISSVWLSSICVNVFSTLLLTASWLRILNLLRVVENRMAENYLRHAVLRTGAWLLCFQLFVGAIWYLWSLGHLDIRATWLILASLLAVTGVSLLVFTIRGLIKSRWPKDHYHYPDHELPSLSVAIPARNESIDLEECLQSIIASDYPKLEILVLDDSSQTKQTPDIIKRFAQNGVRFVQGDPTLDGWLAKNQAYAKLAAAASGEYIVFCGVDTRFSANSLRHLVSVMIDRQKSMLSILPLRHDNTLMRTSLVQAARYMWEISLPRRFFNRPPVLSSCWIIASNELRKAGSFNAVRRSIVPEGYFARRLLKKDGYSFLRSDTLLDIRSTKDLVEQRKTALRMRYPQMRHRPEQALLICLLELAFLIMPILMVIYGIFIEVDTVAWVLFIVASVAVIVAYELVAVATRVSSRLLGFMAQPLAALVDIGLIVQSMLAYEFGQVNWKDRDVSKPVMHNEKLDTTKSRPVVG